MGTFEAKKGSEGKSRSCRFEAIVAVSKAGSSKSRTNATIAESAAKELESLAVHMPNVSHSDARAFALRMYYIEVSNEMSPTDAQTNVSHMFQNYRTHLVCVQRGTPILWLHSLR